MEANKKWMAIPKDVRNELLNNVWCGNCSGETSIVGFIIEDSEMGIVLKGKCKTCGRDVARVVD
ncbi:hypothetical protein [Bacillus marinisedimentorum]|uniref:hypothetical protein n=1 Tax=Bacillus marinisedimentorum TaxID=1821260 RepID=UPI00087303AE|nr:hypothetical protein [Bacillus marinisedimentorum]